MTKDTSPIVGQPPGPGLFGVCPACRRWFALEQIAVRSDRLVGEIHRFRCKNCQTVVEFAKHLPPHVV
jgi:hypothetical protein